MASIADEIESVSYKGTEKKGGLVFTPNLADFTLPVQMHQERWVFDALGYADQMTAYARQVQVEVRLHRVRTALKVYRVLAGVYPTAKQGLAALVAIPKPKPKRWEQSFKEIPKDAWGREFQYTLVDGEPHLRCFGPDGVVSKDDIVLP